MHAISFEPGLTEAGKKFSKNCKEKGVSPQAKKIGAQNKKFHIKSDIEHVAKQDTKPELGIFKNIFGWVKNHKLFASIAGGIALLGTILGILIKHNADKRKADPRICANQW